MTVATMATAAVMAAHRTAEAHRTVAAVAATWPVVLLVPLVVNWPRYPVPGLAVAMWLVLAVTVSLFDDAERY